MKILYCFDVIYSKDTDNTRTSEFITGFLYTNLLFYTSVKFPPLYYKAYVFKAS